VLHLAVGYLREKQRDASLAVGDKPTSLDKQRLEVIFNMLSDVCRPMSLGSARTHADADELPISVQWKLVELVIRLLRLYPAEAFDVGREGAGNSDDAEGGLAGARVRVPRELWSTVTAWVFSPAAFEIPTADWNRAIVAQCLSELDVLPSVSMVDVAGLQTAAGKSDEVAEQSVEGTDEVHGRDDGTTSREGASAMWRDYGFIVDKLRDAPSHGKFLNAIYHLTVLCRASRSARAQLAKQWETIFERYFNVEPKSQRDEVIVGAVIHAMSTILPSMERSGQLRLLLVVKRSLLPLLQRSKCAFYASELARLLLHLSESRVADLFPSLVVDTEIVTCICKSYSAVYSTDPVLHATMLQLLESLIQSIQLHHVSSDAPFHALIRQRLVEMTSPLVTIICRHRAPGSFLENDVFCAAVRCVVGTFRVVSHDELRRGSDPLQHTDASIILDGSWCSRLIFHHVSAVRALGFTVLGEFATIEVQLKMLELAVTTASDEAESDAVRGQACAVVMKLLSQYDELSTEQQVEVAAVVNRDGPVTSSCAKQLVGILKSDRVLVRSAVAFSRLLRVLLRQNTLSDRSSSVVEVLRRGDEEYDLFPELVKVRHFCHPPLRSMSNCVSPLI
jgi:hypothetical protein